MGYDSYECLICYVNGGGNNSPKDKSTPLVTICTTCFKKTSSPLCGNARLNHYVEKTFDKVCDFCCEKKHLVLHKVTMCEDHMEYIDKAISIEENDTELSESDEDSPSYAFCEAGKCKCVRCEHFIDSLLDRFNVNIIKPKLRDENAKLRDEIAQLRAENEKLLLKKN